MADKPFRLLPRLTDRNRVFWQGGKHGELRFLHCEACQVFIHPPQPVCPECLGKELAPASVSGRATVLTDMLAGNFPSGFLQQQATADGAAL